MGEPRKGWSIEEANSARDWLVQAADDPGLADAGKISALQGMVDKFDADVDGGWNPPAAADPYAQESYETPKDRAAGVSGSPNYQAKRDAIHAEARRYADGPRDNASGLLSKTARVDWYPEDGSGGQAYNYREPSPEHLIRYIKRAMNDAPDAATQKEYAKKMRDLHAFGKESDIYGEMSDGMWSNSLRVAQKHGVPIVRIEKKDIQAEDLIRDVGEKAYSVLEPLLLGFEKGVTLGVGRELVASVQGNKVYDEPTQRFLAEMEKRGEFEPFGERVKEMDAGGWRGALGTTAEIGGAMMGMSIPGLALKGAGKVALRAGAKSLMAGAKATPALLRGTALGSAKIGGRAKRGLIEGAVAGGAEAGGEAAVRKAGRAIRDEGQGEEYAPIDVGTSALMGVGLGGAAGGALAGIGGLAANRLKALRKGEDDVARDMGLVQMAHGPDVHITELPGGIRKTAGMEAAEEAALGPHPVGEGTQLDAFRPSDMALEGVSRKVLAANTRREVRVIEFQKDDMGTFYSANSAPDMHYKGAAEEVYALMKTNKEIPFEDASLARDSFREMTDFEAYSGIVNAQAMADSAGHIAVISKAEAVEIYGRQAVDKKLAKMDAPPPLKDEKGEEYADTIHFVVDALSVSPQKYDKSIQALDRKINYDRTASGRDPIWGNLRHRVAQDRSTIPGWQAKKDKHHAQLNEIEDRWRALDLSKPFHELPDTGTTKVSIDQALRGNMAPDAIRKGGFRDALAEAPGATQAFLDARAIKARERLISGITELPGSQAEFKRKAFRLFAFGGDAIAEPIERKTRNLGGRRTGQAAAKAYQMGRDEER